MPTEVLAAVLSDLAEAPGAPHPATSALRHIAHLAVRTRDPDGETTWEWDDPDSPQRVEGTALDLCLLAVQRCHRSDTGLVAIGHDAGCWLDIAQAFAGPPGPGRHPRATR